MKFKVKIADGAGRDRRVWWEEYDDPRVIDQRDAFAYGKVLCEYWNSDLRNGEMERKCVNAAITGKGVKSMAPVATLMSRSRNVQ